MVNFSGPVWSTVVVAGCVGPPGSSGLLETSLNPMSLFSEVVPLSKPHPPVVGKVTHHSIELYWDLEQKEKRQGPQEQWLRFSIEEEDPKMHSYGVIYT
jgi:hypothetical protein